MIKRRSRGWRLMCRRRCEVSTTWTQDSTTDVVDGVSRTTKEMDQYPILSRARAPPQEPAETTNLGSEDIHSILSDGKDPYSGMCRRRRRRRSNNNNNNNNNNRKYFYGHKVVLSNRPMDETRLQRRKFYSKRQTILLAPRPRNTWSLPLREACQPEKAQHFFFEGTLPTHLSVSVPKL
jgi:hypothetical protein